MMEFLQSLERLRFSTWVREGGAWYGYASILFVHVVGMGMVAGMNSLIALRLLGISPKTPVRPLERLYPIIWWGFWVNAATGTVLLIADATTKLLNPDFYVKMIFVFSGMFVITQIRKKVFRFPKLDEAPLPSSARGLAWASLVCWLAAITAGRLMAYLGPVSGLAGGH